APERAVSRQRAGTLPRQDRLRLEDRLVGVPAADLACDGAVVRDYPEAASRRGAAERTDRNEVRAAHVPGEERRKDLQRAPPCDVRDGHEPVESDFRDGPRRGLEVLPQQEEPDQVAAGGDDACKVAVDLGSLEAPPPLHRARCGPVIDADAVGLTHATRVPARTRSYTRR